jgi:DNA-binding beta-propeller fold protein YncE
LFEFGDVDGKEDDVRLQHPLGVALYGGKVLIADTYNHKIKELDTEKRTVTTFLGTGKAGQKDGNDASFYEPAGLSIADGKLFVADTNNQAIRVVDLKTKAVSTLKIEGLAPPAEITNEEKVSPNAKEIKTSTQEVSANAASSLIFNIALPEGFHLNQNAPNRYEISLGTTRNVKFVNPAQKFLKLPLSVPFQTTKAGTADLRAKLTVFYCREDNTGTCQIKTLAFRIPLKVIAYKKAATKVQLSASVE